MAPVDRNFISGLRTVWAAEQIDPTYSGHREEGFPSKPKSANRPQVFGCLYLTCSMAQKCAWHLLRLYAAAVVDHADQLLPATPYLHPDVPGTRVDGVVYQFT